MRRLLVVLAIGTGPVAFAAFAAFAAYALGATAACGGPDKPPLTPDTEMPNPDGAEAGPAPTGSSAPK